VSYSNINNPVNYQLQGFGQNGVRTISTDQLYIQGEYYRVLVAEEDSYVTAVSVLGDDLTAEFVYAGTTIYGLFTEVSVSSGSLTAYIAGPTDIEDVWAYINAYGQTNAATIEAADCAKDAIAPLLDKYYAKASLVMVPSLYKTSIVYSERPLTTDGQLAFTRSNDTATRVGPDGYIEKVRTNLLLHSQAFDNAGWVKVTGGTATAPVVTANAAVAPDGTTTADRIQFSVTGTTGSDFSIIRQGVAGLTGSTTYAFSVYLRSNTGASQDIILYDQNSGTTLTASVTTTWQRFTFNRTTGAGTTTFIPSIAVIGNINSGDKDILAWGAQLEYSDFGATDYIPTTASAVSVGPVANLPRLNYPINSDGSVGCPSLLLEPQRTNLCLWSESFDNAAWTKSQTSITANNTTSPDGYVNADRLAGDGTSNVHSIFQSITVANATSYAWSFLAKKNTHNFIQLSGSAAGFGLNVWANFDLNNGVVGSVGSSTTARIDNYGNGWYRCTIIGTSVANTAVNMNLLLVNSATSARGEINTISKSVFLYGCQMEAGAYATSYIPTLGASVTRGADACSKTGISSLIGQTQGTLFAEVEFDTNSTDLVNRIFSVTDGTTTSRILMCANTDETFRFIVSVAAATVVNITTSASIFGGRHKVAFAYKANDFIAYVDGVQVGSNTAVSSVPASLTAAYIGTVEGGASSQILEGTVSQALLFKTRLTNQELQDLTTL